MSNNSRTKNVAKNFIFQIVYELFLVVAGILFPRLIILKYGSDVNGLTSTINHLVQILNLIQAGAVGASIFQMFKPVAEKDYKTVNNILYSSRIFFSKLGTVFLLLVVVVSPAMLFLDQESSITATQKVLSFLILGLNSAFYFFFVSWFDILFSSFQKRYYLSIASLVDKIVYYLVLFLILQSKLHFIWMYVAILICTLIKIGVLLFTYRKTFHKILPKDVTDKHYKIPNKGYLLANQISSQLVDAFPSVTVSYLVGLSYSSVLSVYLLIQNMTKMVFNTLQQSVSEVYGNLVNSKEDSQRFLYIYNKLEYSFFSVGLIIGSCVGFLCVPFVFVYTNQNTFDVNYIYPLISLSLVLFCISYCMYMPCFTLTNVLGYYKETYKQSIVFAVISIAFSVGLCFINWALICFGPVLYYLLCTIHRNYILKKRVRSFSYSKVLARTIVLGISTVPFFVVSHFFVKTVFWSSWIKWLLFAVIVFLAATIIWLIYSVFFEKDSLKYFMKTFRNILKTLKRKSN